MKKLLSFVMALTLVIGLLSFTTVAAAEDTWYLGILVHSLDNEFWRRKPTAASCSRSL